MPERRSPSSAPHGDADRICLKGKGAIQEMGEKFAANPVTEDWLEDSAIATSRRPSLGLMRWMCDWTGAPGSLVQSLSQSSMV